MRVYRIPVDAHPLVKSMHKLLLACPVPPDSAIERKGDLALDLSEALTPTPSTRPRHVPTAFIRAPLNDLKAQARGLMKPGFEVRGAAYCPKGGGLGWHTNGDAPGWRIYLVRPLMSASVMDTPESGLLTVNAHEIAGRYPALGNPDEPGKANLFYCDARSLWPETSWHAVTAWGHARMSLGMRVPDRFAADLLTVHRP